MPAAPDATIITLHMRCTIEGQHIREVRDRLHLLDRSQ